MTTGARIRSTLEMPTWKALVDPAMSTTRSVVSLTKPMSPPALNHGPSAVISRHRIAHTLTHHVAIVRKSRATSHQRVAPIRCCEDQMAEGIVADVEAHCRAVLEHLNLLGCAQRPLPRPQPATRPLF
jgi:hypothetical protein